MVAVVTDKACKGLWWNIIEYNNILMYYLYIIIINYNPQVLQFENGIIIGLSMLTVIQFKN